MKEERLREKDDNEERELDREEVSRRSPTKSSEERTKKERGRGRASDSALARNSGRYKRQRLSPEEDTTADKACNSPTRRAVAKATPETEGKRPGNPGTPSSTPDEETGEPKRQSPCENWKRGPNG